MSDKSIPELVEALEAVVSRLPQGEWTAKSYRDWSNDGHCDEREWIVIKPDSEDFSAMNESEATLIVLAHNHLPALLADWRRLRDEYDHLRSIVYGDRDEPVEPVKIIKRQKSPRTLRRKEQSR